MELCRARLKLRCVGRERCCPLPVVARDSRDFPTEIGRKRATLVVAKDSTARGRKCTIILLINAWCSILPFHANKTQTSISYGCMHGGVRKPSWNSSTKSLRHQWCLGSVAEGGGVDERVIPCVTDIARLIATRTNDAHLTTPSTWLQVVSVHVEMGSLRKLDKIP